MDFQDFKDAYQKVPIGHYPNNVPDDPVVSVCVQTYQHVDYIEDCLEGILMQKTDFSYEILLGEDASTDGTREICIKYAQKYPDKIRLFLHERENNITIAGQPTGRFNFLYNLYSAKGKYIAFCEGDDYWTDPLKLQKQVAFMDQHEDCSLCFHAVKTSFANNHKNDLITGPKAEEYQVLSPEDIIEGIFVRTVSMVFRSEVVADIPYWFIEAPYGDLPLQLTCASKGYIGYINCPMATYRRGILGAWSEAQFKDREAKGEWYKKRYQDHLTVFNLFDEATNYKYHKEINTRKKNQKIGYLISCQDLYNKTKTYKLIRKNFSVLLNLKNIKVLKFWIRFIFGNRFYHYLKKSIKQFV